MAMNEAALGGGFALAGVAMQQFFTILGERRALRRDTMIRLEAEQHEAFVLLVTAGRRVQRALVDRETLASAETNLRLGVELDHLTEAAVVVRLITRDAELLEVVEAFEERAKRLEESSAAHPDEHLKLGALIDQIQRFEARMATSA